MAGQFAFMAGKFPDIAEDAAKAESYLYTDNTACMLYISRVFDGILKALCRAGSIALKEDGLDRTSADLIDELAQKKVICGKNLRFLHNMRIFRNKNAHNEDTSLDDSIRLLKQAHYLCKWLVKNYGGNKETPRQITISIADLMNEHERDALKYEGVALTLTGGKVLKVSRAVYGKDAFIVSLMSSPVESASGFGTITYKVDCCFPLSMEETVSALKPGQNFTASGIWKGGKLINDEQRKPRKTHSKTPRIKQRHKERNHQNYPFWVLVIIIAVIYAVCKFFSGGLTY